MALCRCGVSAIKPWCDGTHKAIGFTTAGARTMSEATAAAASISVVIPVKDDAQQLRGVPAGARPADARRR